MIIRKVSVVPRSAMSRWIALGVMAIGATGCTDWAGYDLDYALGRVPIIGTMRQTVAIKAQTMPRLPAPGTVAYEAPGGTTVPRFVQSQLDSVAATLVNPLPASAAVIARGEQVYGNLCFSCHGVAGAGNGPVVGGGRFPLGPALNDAVAAARSDGYLFAIQTVGRGLMPPYSDRVSENAARSDGYLFAIQTVGRGLMPPYSDRVSENDQWAVVHYLRQLQGGAAVAAVPAAQ